MNMGHQWQPIGVSTVEPSRAYMLGDASCPAANEMRKAISNLTYVKNFLKENSDFLKRFSNKSGLDVTRKWYTVSLQSDSLVCYENYFGKNFLYPSWIDEVGTDVWDRLNAFRNFGFGIFSGLGVDFFKLKAGPFIKEMITNLNATIQKGKITNENRELFTYGTHDIVLSYILHAFGLWTEQVRVNLLQ